MRRFRKYADPFCFWLVVAMIVLSPIEYLAIVSWPDSTDYFLQEVVSAVHGPDDRKYIYVGDDLLVKAFNYRHLINGTCLLSVDRFRENVGGKFDKKRTLIQQVDQYFVGDGKIRQTSWPIRPEVITVTEAWFDDPEAEEQEMDIYTTGVYDCNFLDFIRKALGFPRIMHDGVGNDFREKTRVVLRRAKP